MPEELSPATDRGSRPIGREDRLRPWQTSPAAVLASALAVSVPAFAAKPLDVVRAEEHAELADGISRLRAADPARRARLLAETLDPQALIRPEDRDPLDVVLRRARALLAHLGRTGAIDPALEAGCRSSLEAITARASAETDGGRRRALFDEACGLRRRIAFANSLLDFDSIIAMLEAPGDARIIEQARAVWPGHAAGGGPIVIHGWKGEPEVSRPLDGVPISSGPGKGEPLSGKFSGLELDPDGRTILFAATWGSEAWRIFRFVLGTRDLECLTDGAFDDFDPCPLPSGRIAFTSTRRGGIGRCVLTPQSLTYTLHSMEADGSDIIALSFHETNEWQPAVTNEGRIAYTRWDYVDRHWGTAHHFWECFPDGRDPRNFHGNYPLPWCANPPGTEPSVYGQRGLVDGRVLRPDAEVSFRPVPGSPKFTATAVGHHEGFSGSLVLVDPEVPDDGRMAQVRRITPEYPFPEVEAGGAHAFGTAWPLGEDFFLCSFWTGLYLLDRFGNREVIHDLGPGPMRIRDPFPLRSRRRPPVIPAMTWQGRRSPEPGHQPATIAVIDAREADAVARLPDGVRIRWMRIVQVIPQLLVDRCCSRETISLVSFADDSIGRIPLGVVPVEDDGSVHCEAPVGKALYFQLLDEEGMAVASMRSVTYVHPGERLVCFGCHEDKWRAVPARRVPAALRRPPSPIVPELDGGPSPFSYVDLVKRPVFDRLCVPCHRDHPRAPDMSYRSLARFDRAFSYPGEAGLNLLGVGGSRTAPGRFGAMASGIWKSLREGEQHRGVRLTDDERRRLTLWLDLNSNELGWIGNDPAGIEAQRRGEPLWPPIDVDPRNPLGVEEPPASPSFEGGGTPATPRRPGGLEVVELAGSAAGGTVIDCGGGPFNGGKPTELLIRAVKTPGGWDRPEGIVIRRCRIRGSIRILGMGRNGEAEEVRRSSVKEGHTARAQAAAPAGVLISDVEIEGQGRIPVYLAPGTTGATIEGCRISGRSNSVGIYLDAESAGNVIRGNVFSLEAGREVIAVDGSAGNRIEDNRFERPSRGGIYLYRNCGEGGTVRHQTPHGNTIARNRFETAALGPSARGIWLGSRNGRRIYCGLDAGHPFGSSADDRDFADDNVLEGNVFDPPSDRAIEDDGNGNIVR